MSDSKTTSYDDEREKRIQEIQDLLFKEKSPEKIHDFLNNFFTESRNKALENNPIPKIQSLLLNLFQGQKLMNANSLLTTYIPIKQVQNLLNPLRKNNKKI